MPDDISKCRLIKKLLQGPVKELTQCYRDTAADYKNLAEALKERYDQPDILLSYLQRKLRDMRIPERETAASLRTFYTQIQALCRQLTDAGRNTDDPMITDTIYSKLPAKMKAKVAEQRLASPADGWSTQKLLDLMKAHVRLAEHISLSNDAQYPVVEKKDVPQHRNVHAIQASSTSPEDDYANAYSDVGDQEDSHEATSVSSGLAPLSHPMPAVGSAGKVVYNIYNGVGQSRDVQGKRSGPPHMPKSSTKAGERRQNNVHLLAREDQTDGDESLSDGSEIVDEIASDAESDLNYGLEPPSAVAHVLVTQKEENVMALGTAKRTLMMTAKADVSNGSDKSLKRHCTIFFDCGSSETLITKDLATKLDLPVLERSMTTFHHFGEKKGRSMVTWRVQFDVHLNDGTLMPIEADAVDYLCGSMPTMSYGPGPVAVALELSYKAVNATMEEPQILIGLDYIHEFELTRRIPRLPNGFYVYDSRVGQILCGRGKVVGRQPTARQVNLIQRTPSTGVSHSDDSPPSHTVSAIVQKDQELQAIERLVQLEALGIESPDQVNEEEAVMERHRETLKRLPDGRYEVSFPYREEVLQLLRGGVPLHKILATNYRPALARLNSIWKTYLRDNPECRDNYSNAFEVQLSRKIIELVDPHTLSEDEQVLVHYLAHHPVFRADKPTQLRIVFDGSARSGPGTRSLNDCLHPGPSLLESLIGILLRSRIASVLILGDIEKAFLQIGLRPEDRDVTRFLWLKDPAKPPTPDNLL
ncbi:Zinc knuckle family protein, partial [Aphelenchoides avenae]